ncbi:Vacuolar fusion protein CCZ1-like protein [Armadillidium vulgare]|nr:Vacuolar fusion protein CCZ1-like protein [Armadillidium vulgare]
MSNPKESPKLLNFFIFHSKYGQREGYEHEKLLYYYPKNENLDTQVRNVGLAEAITRFASTFNKQEDCESLHTQKSHQVYYQAEPNIWMVMVKVLDIITICFITYSAKFFNPVNIL